MLRSMCSAAAEIYYRNSCWSRFSDIYRVHAKGVVLCERACFCLLSAFYNTPPSKNPSRNPCPYWNPHKVPSKNPSKMSTEPEPETGTVGTVGTVSQEPNTEPEPPEPFSRNRNRNRPLCQTVLKHTKPKTGAARTVPSPNRNRTEPNRGHPVFSDIYLSGFWCVSGHPAIQ